MLQALGGLGNGSEVSREASRINMVAAEPLTMGLPLCLDCCQEVSAPLTVGGSPVMLTWVSGYWAQARELVFCLDLEM